jgi:hypothetical protein
MSNELSPTDIVAYAAQYVGRQQNLFGHDLTEYIRAELLEFASIGCESERAAFLELSEAIVLTHWFEIDY